MGFWLSSVWLVKGNEALKHSELPMDTRKNPPQQWEVHNKEDWHKVWKAWMDKNPTCTGEAAA